MTRRDDEGRPAEWITTREPEWDAEDRAIMSALADFEAGLCRDCGHPLSETLHVDGVPDPTFDAFYAVCLSCKARGRAHHIQSQKDEALLKSGGFVFADARKWVTKKRE